MISESMERRLTLREHLLVTVHLWACSWCQWYMEHLNLLREALRKEAAEASELELSSTPGLSDEARARLKRNLANRS